MRQRILSVLLLAACTAATAKLPAPDDAAKAKAAETAAKAAWQAKVDAYLLCKSQDRVAAKFRSTGATAPKAAVVPTAAASAAPAAAAAPAAPAASGTPVAAAPAAAPAPCADPGKFAYTPPVQKPLEAAGAHSPSPTAANPPNTATPAAAMAPATKP